MESEGACRRSTRQNACSSMVICRACCHGGQRSTIKNLRLISHIVSRTALPRKAPQGRLSSPWASLWTTTARYARIAITALLGTIASWFARSAAITLAAQTITETGSSSAQLKLRRPAAKQPVSTARLPASPVQIQTPPSSRRRENPSPHETRRKAGDNGARCSLPPARVPTQEDGLHTSCLHRWKRRECRNAPARNGRSGSSSQPWDLSLASTEI